MKTKSSSTNMLIGKVAYGAVFVLVLPIVLVAWAVLTEDQVTLPRIESVPVGVFIAAAGSVIVLWGMAAIYLLGKGLPMNAYPPERFVSESIYGLIAHPIYVGFCLLCVGISIAAGSRSGLWLVSPAVAIGCAALVAGYEAAATRERFGPPSKRPFLHYPTARGLRATMSDRVSICAFGIAPWLFTILALGTTESATLQAEVPVVLPSLYLMYLIGHLLVLLPPLLVRPDTEAREYTNGAVIATIGSIWLFMVFPYSFPSIGPGNDIFQARHAALIAMHVSLLLWSARALAKIVVKARLLFYLAAALTIAAGAVTMPGFIFAVPAGFLLFILTANAARLRRSVLSGTEWIANSWREWRGGPFRIINHGFYVALGAFASLSIIAALVGPQNVLYTMFIAGSGIVVSGLAAQWIEGSPSLLRPYGWYGGMLGTILGLGVVTLLGGDVWLLFAAFCVGAPWVQSAGRLRCLVQGCCHGREVREPLGIRYEHPISRVCTLSGLKGKSLHATPLYSILINIVVAVLMLRLWIEGASLTLIVGVYLITTGLGRFVEESYRGEPQTPMAGKLRLYQLFAIITVLLGILITMIPGSGFAPELVPNWFGVAASAVFGLFALIAFGVDLPASKRRFARLTME